MQDTRSIKPLILAVTAMLAQQSFAFMSILVLPVAAPKMAGELGLPLSLIGAYYVFLYGVAVIFALGGGGYIQRHGALRMSQVALVSNGCGLMMAGLGIVYLLPVSAAMIGFGTAMSTPASTVILARVAPPRHAPLAFSIKQTGVPAGGILTGLLVPYFTARFGWRGAFVACGAMCLIMSVLLQPLRRLYDRQRQEGYGLSLAGMGRMLKSVLSDPRYRELAITSAAYVGVQAIFGAFFVTFLATDLGYDLTQAGRIFAIAQAVSVIARVFWGWLSGRYVAPRTMLGILGVAMSVACAVTGLYTADWKTVAITAVAVAYSGTAISFHGVLISEIARIAPAGQVGPLTGGIMVSFASIGTMIYPSLFGLILQLTGSFGYGFFVAALPALGVGLTLFRPARNGMRPAAVESGTIRNAKR